MRPTSPWSATISTMSVNPPATAISISTNRSDRLWPDVKASVPAQIPSTRANGAMGTPAAQVARPTSNVPAINRTKPTDGLPLASLTRLTLVHSRYEPIRNRKTPQWLRYCEMDVRGPVHQSNDP